LYSMSAPSHANKIGAISNDQKKRFISQTLVKIFKTSYLSLLACAAERNK